mmetsp:Transcript_39971/g.86520  ORF Transcript_39971/g.86520 Transcript_39971/m.86520 type:complete len:227 (-) Transcript_39971:75-755(-)
MQLLFYMPALELRASSFSRLSIAGLPWAFALSCARARAILLQVPTSLVGTALSKALAHAHALAPAAAIAHHPFHLLNLTACRTQEHHFLGGWAFLVHRDVELARASLRTKSTGKLRPQHKDILVRECFSRDEAEAFAWVVALDLTVVGSLLGCRDHLHIFCHGSFLSLADCELHLVTFRWAEPLQVLLVQEHVLTIALHKSPALVWVESFHCSIELHGTTRRRLYR